MLLLDDVLCTRTNLTRCTNFWLQLPNPTLCDLPLCKIKSDLLSLGCFLLMLRYFQPKVFSVSLNIDSVEMSLELSRSAQLQVSKSLFSALLPINTTLRFGCGRPVPFCNTISRWLYDAQSRQMLHVLAVFFRLFSLFSAYNICVLVH